MAIICSAGGWDVVVDVDARLRERGLGELEGRPARPVAAYADGDLDWSPSGGESYRDLARRLFAFLVERLRDPELAGRSVLVCSHVGPMRLLRGMVDREVDPAKVLAAEFPNLSAVSFTGEEICIPAFLGELPSDG
jgi:broad specificity phosphatase PhoE